MGHSPLNACLDVIPYDDRTQKHPAGSHLPEWLPKHEFLMIIVAPAGSGKTTLLLNMILRIYRQYWHRILIFSPTVHNDSKWEYIFDDEHLLLENKNRVGKKDLEDWEQKRGTKLKNQLVKEEDREDEMTTEMKKKWAEEMEKKRLKDLKQNEILDPLNYSKKDRKNAKRIGLSRAAMKQVMGNCILYDEQHPEPFDNVVLKKNEERHHIISRLERRQELACKIVKPPVPEVQKQLREFKTNILRIPSTKIRQPHLSWNTMWSEAQTLKQQKNQTSEDDIESEDDSEEEDEQEGEEQNNDDDENNKHTKVTKKDVFEEYSEETLNKEMEWQDKTVSYFKAHKKDLVENVDRMLWVFDDMVGSGLFNQKRNNAFKRLSVRRRHFYSSIMGVTQAYKEIPKTTRTNANILIFFKIDSDEELQTIYREYPMGHKYKDWLKIVDYCTNEPHSFIMFNLQTSNPDHRICKQFNCPLSETAQQYIIRGVHPTDDNENPQQD